MKGFSDSSLCKVESLFAAVWQMMQENKGSQLTEDLLAKKPPAFHSVVQKSNDK